MGSFAASFRPRPNKLDPALPVQPTAAQNPWPTRLWTRFSHNDPTLHRGLQAPCGRRGKLGSLSTAFRPLIQSSSIAQPCFRKPAIPSNPYASISSEGFPLFLPQLRVLLAFLLSTYPFPPPAPRPHPVPTSTSPPRRRPSTQNPFPIRPNHPIPFASRGLGIQKSDTFSTPTADQKMNTIK